MVIFEKMFEADFGVLIMWNTRSDSVLRTKRMILRALIACRVSGTKRVT
jgi:hypothetical protein